MITLYSLPDLPKSSANVLSQARNAHTFAITSYTATISKKKSQADLKSGEGKKIRRDLLVVACRKKVVVYGAGRGGLKEGWVSVSSSSSLVETDVDAGHVPSTLTSTCHLPFRPFFFHYTSPT
jgi:hypothetical protein